LQESLAAALLKIAGYTSQEVLIDPCCGSGTFLIEAALIATNTPPAYFRKHFGFMNHPDFDRTKWLSIKNNKDKQIKALKPGIISGCERDSEVVRICRANLRAVGFEREIEIFGTDFSKFDPKLSYNFLITNPPHGIRIGEEEKLKKLYKLLGDFMKKKLAKPARAFIFTTSSFLGKAIGLATKRRHVLKSSGLDARLLEFDIY